MSFENKIKELNIILPKAPDPVGSYVATKISDKLLYISGQISINDKGELIKGKLGKDLKTEAGYEAAKRCALNIIAQAKKACAGDLSKIKSCIKLTGYVNSSENFIEQPKVINGASDLIASVFGDIGMHTRAAVSANSLPLGVAVEVDAIFELNWWHDKSVDRETLVMTEKKPKRTCKVLYSKQQIIDDLNQIIDAAKKTNKI